MKREGNYQIQKKHDKWHATATFTDSKTETSLNQEKRNCETNHLEGFTLF